MASGVVLPFRERAAFFPFVQRIAESNRRCEREAQSGSTTKTLEGLLVRAAASAAELVRV